MNEQMDKSMQKYIDDKFDRLSAKVQQRLGDTIDRHYEGKNAGRDQVKGIIDTVSESETRFKSIEDRLELDKRSARIDTLIIENADFPQEKQ